MDDHFESSRPGVHVIGELAGMGLIRNAVEQGAQCAAHLADVLPAQPPPGDVADVVVIGSGPAGVSCALGLRARGRSVRLVDRNRLGEALAHFPRHGLAMNGPLQLPGSGRLRQQRVGKQELLAYFEKALARLGQRAEEGVVVTGLAGEDGAFAVQTGTGTIATRKVVLATGRRGAPRKLGVPGEELPKVTYWLIEPEQYAGARVLVVGGGDAAVEAACSLAEAGCARVVLSHRRPELTRCRQANAARAVELAGKGLLELMASSEVRQIEQRSVTLQQGSETVVLPNDHVIACLGGELPLAFLDKMGVRVRRHHGQEEAAAGPGERRRSWTDSRQEAERRLWRRRMAFGAALVLVLLAVLAWVGRDYYSLAGRLRLRSPLHPRLKPASRLGIDIGIGASAVMLTNFLYVLRKRWSALAGFGNLGTWLDLHVFVGILSPLVIAFHAAFQSNNLMASATYTWLGIVVATGLVGRYFYGLVPGSNGRAAELADLLGQIERLEQRVEPMVAEASTPEPLRALFQLATSPPRRAPFLVQLLESAPAAAAFWLRLAAALLLVPPGRRAALGEGLAELMRLRRQVSLFGGIHRLMRAWRSLHISLAVMLVVVLLAHISLSLYLGYGPGHR